MCGWCGRRGKTLSIEHNMVRIPSTVRFCHHTRNIMNFTLSKEQIEIASDWLFKKRAEHLALQKEQIAEPNIFMKQCWEGGYPYTGAIGGDVTYMFTSTSLGVIAKIQYLDNDELDLTDYENW